MDTYRKAIEKARDNGYEFTRPASRCDILFDHEFWKVLHKSFDPPRCNPSGYPYTWKYYLTEFALSTDREAYLKDLLKSMEDNEKESKNKR